MLTARCLQFEPDRSATMAQPVAPGPSPPVEHRGQRQVGLVDYPAMDDDADDETGSARTYRHDPAQVAALAQFADRACDGVTDIPDAGTRIPSLAAETSPPLAPAAIAQLVNLFSYTLSVEAVSRQAGATLEPLDGPSFYPPALRDANSDVRALWVDLAGAVTHPIARARCHDIVFTLRLGHTNRDHAEQAVGAYLEAVGGSLRRREQSEGLVRAWTLMRAVGLDSLEPQITAAMMGMAEVVINQAEDPHAAHPLLAALTARRPKATQPPNPRAHALLDQGLTTFTATHHFRVRHADPRTSRRRSSSRRTRQPRRSRCAPR